MTETANIPMPLGVEKQWLNSHGYIVYVINGSIVQRSHFLMESHLGRKLESDEAIHHINGIKTDDRIENLQILTRRGHSAFHNRERNDHVSHQMMQTRELADIRSQIFDDAGHIREGVIVVKHINDCGPYGYQVFYQRGINHEGHHIWEYLGRAEPGLPVGTYAPGTPLIFYRGRKRELKDRQILLTGNWDRFRTTADLSLRLENAGYLSEVVE